MSKSVALSLGIVWMVLAAQGADTPQAYSLVNEQGTLRFCLVLDGAGLGYEVSHVVDGTVTPVIERSPLGITRTDEDFSAGLAMVSAGDARRIDETYLMLTGKQSRIHGRGLERTFTLSNRTGSLVAITVRAYPDGVAFRYGFPGHGQQVRYLAGEATGFKLSTPGQAWMQDYSKVGTWAPAYESDYRNGMDIGTAAPAVEGWAMPVLFHTSGLWVLVTEAGLDETSYAVHLEQNADGGLYRVRLPEKPETYGVAPQEAALTLPWQGPWRTVIIGPSLGDIVESNLVSSLSKPCALKDLSWITPGRVSWSWWYDHSSSNDYAKLTPYVDLAQRLGWEYSTVDLGWHEMRHGSIEQLISYAKARDVGLILWYNTAGKHNQVPDAAPRDILHDPVKRDAEMARLEKLGIKGIKVDFFQSDKQSVVGLYLDILRDAARHHLLVDFHGATIPRGWSRTYPNLMTMEAVRGAEQYWDEGFAENAQTFHTIYAFTRNVVGSMDYTPLIFTDSPDTKPHKTTYAHELALSVVFESGLQHFVDSPRSLLSQPVFVQDFLKAVPVAWDQTHFVDGYPGVLCVLARRKGQVWYVAGINGERTAKTVQVPLGFLGKGPYEASLICDGGSPHEFAHKVVRVSNQEVLSVEMAGRGGFASRWVRR